MGERDSEALFEPSTKPAKWGGVLGKELMSEGTTVSILQQELRSPILVVELGYFQQGYPECTPKMLLSILQELPWTAQLHSLHLNNIFLWVPCTN